MDFDPIGTRGLIDKEAVNEPNVQEGWPRDCRIGTTAAHINDWYRNFRRASEVKKPTEH
jgi:hypothetical protein